MFSVEEFSLISSFPNSSLGTHLGFETLFRCTRKQSFRDNRIPKLEFGNEEREVTAKIEIVRFAF